MANENFKTDLSRIDTLRNDAKHLEEKLSDLTLLTERTHQRWIEVGYQYQVAKVSCELKRIRLEDAYHEKSKVIERLKSEGKLRSDLWNEFYSFRDEKNEEIKPIEERIQDEDDKMKTCFADADNAKFRGDKKSAAKMVKEAKRHKAYRDKLRESRDALIDQIRDKRQETQARIEASNDPEFREKNQAYEKVANEYARLKQERNRLAEECSYYEKEFRAAEKGFNRIKKKYNKAVFELKEAESARFIMAALVSAMVMDMAIQCLIQVVILPTSARLLRHMADIIM